MEKRRRGAGNYAHPSDPVPSPDSPPESPDPLSSVGIIPMEKRRRGETETSGSPTEGAALVPSDPVASSSEALQVRYPSDPVQPPPEIQRIAAVVIPSGRHDYKSSTEIPKHFVIAFVNEFEKAHQYLRFKDHFISLKQISLEMAFQAQPSFPLLEEYDLRMAIPEVQQAIHPHYANLIDELFRQPFESPRPRVVDLNSVRNPIFYIVFRAHKQGYVPMATPEEELFKIQKFAPFFFMDRAIHWEVPVDDEVKTVAVSNLSLAVSEREIRNFFGICGGIKHVEVSSKSQGTVYVIFKDFAAVLPALKYSGLVSEQLCEKTPTGNKALLVELKSVTDISDAESTRRRDESIRSMYDVHVGGIACFGLTILTPSLNVAKLVKRKTSGAAASG